MALRTVDDVFADYLGRRRGIIKALTVEVRSLVYQRAPAAQHPQMHRYLRAERRSTCARQEPAKPRARMGLWVFKKATRSHLSTADHPMFACLVQVQWAASPRTRLPPLVTLCT